MKFASILNLVGLSSDPATGEDGDLYYDTDDGKIKARLKGLWVHITDNEHLKESIVPEIFITGDSSTASVSVTLQKIHSENTLKCISASVTQIIIPDQNVSDLIVASRINVVRASGGEVEIMTQNASVSFSSPSDIYLTKPGTQVKLINIGFNEWILTGEFPDLY
jgi:hypothetical protein